MEQESAIAVQEARLLREFDQRGAYRRDACVSTMGWLRLRTELSHAAAKRKLQRAWTLRRMPLLTGALAAGQGTTEHVDVIARRAIPARLERIAAHNGVHGLGQVDATTTALLDRTVHARQGPVFDA